VKDPDIFLTNLDIHFVCAVDESKEASIAADHRRYVNWEIFYFANKDAMAKFDKDPLAYCGRVTDPVNMVRFSPDALSPLVDRNGRPYFFSSDSTRTVFEKAPDEYAEPRLKMMKKTDS
jgi:YHS domain-containing protein